MDKNNLSISIQEFSRDYYKGKSGFAYIGNGKVGGKAKGLIEIREELIGMNSEDDNVTDKFRIDIPESIVLTTQFFDEFMDQNDLYETALSDRSDERITHRFLKAELPVKLTGDLRLIAENIRSPLAIRSSSLIEDSLNIPLAGVYGTKMIPNNDPDPDIRFEKLAEAVKFVYSSTFHLNAKTYLSAAGKDIRTEKMGVIIQNVVGINHNKRHYPDISGVAKSYNFYSSGHAEPSDGIVSLALGLGKTIVDGGKSWNYCPVYPESPPPFNSVRDILKQTQSDFWAVKMDKISNYDPLNESEFLVNLSIKDAEYDNTLYRVASTYNHESDRFDLGTGNNGARLINFAPLLQTNRLPLNDIIRKVMKKCEEKFRTDVEIEFAVNLENKNCNENIFYLLQVRPMSSTGVKNSFVIEIPDSESILTSSSRVLGHGIKENITEVVYVKPGNFNLKNSMEISSEIDLMNRELLKINKSYLLIGFGRWGSSDPWLGIPVNWSQISGAEVIIESSLPGVNIDMSQGSHFFHNISNMGIFYFSVSGSGATPVDWRWLESREIITDRKYVRHISLKKPMTIKVDGKAGKGVILK